LLKGGLGNVEGLRRQNPLPETAEELCTVARDLGRADPGKAVNLGANATEARVKALMNSRLPSPSSRSALRRRYVAASSTASSPECSFKMLTSSSWPPRGALPNRGPACCSKTWWAQRNIGSGRAVDGRFVQVAATAGGSPLA
jgi:hypothetical protein